MALADFKDIVQNKPASCGAFALAAALESLGCMPASFKISCLNAALNDYIDNPKAARILFAEFLYAGTGNLVLASTNPLKPGCTSMLATYNYKNDPMNSPSGLVKMASIISGTILKEISVNVTTTSQAKAVFSGIPVTNVAPNPNLYDKDKALVEAITYSVTTTGGGTALQAVAVKDALTSYAAPVLGELQLLLVDPGSGIPNHWIAAEQGAAGQSNWYDPGTGRVDLGSSFKLTPSGFWISLKKP